MYPEVLEVFKEYTVFIGGSTSFDIVAKQYNKYDATMEYAKMHGYTKEQVLFMGDDMGDGGGDSHVRLGGMDYIHVLDYTRIPEMAAFLLE
jgi:hydroxymethylpyrimidine pyrophosphatase-like HAD family hydrolase